MANIRAIGSDSGSFASAVIVRDSELIHTAQLFPVTQHFELVGADEPAKQIDWLMNQLVNVVVSCDAPPENIVKLNFYITDATVVKPLLFAIGQRFPDHAKPAVSFVTTRLPVAGAVVAVDAVAVRESDDEIEQVDRKHFGIVGGSDRFAHAAVLPKGDVIYISGQAEKGDGLEDATEKTLAGLSRTLDHLGLDLDDVAEVKCFVQPMADSGAAYRALEEFFGDRLVPPITLVEWISTLPVEIEMVVHAPASESDQTVTYEWLPWLSVSPVYCQLTRIRGGILIFTSGFMGDPRQDEAAQVAGVFNRLQRTLEEAGSDIRHVAKATYYVVNEEASRQVNEIRPTLYDPQRPPAASKALVYGAGLPMQSVTIDMIAAPASTE